MTDDGADGERLSVWVELVGGPWDGHRQRLLSTADLGRPRESLGTWMVVEAPPPGFDVRAVYEPDPAPAPADRWHYQGLIYT